MRAKLFYSGEKEKSAASLSVKKEEAALFCILIKRSF